MARTFVKWGFKFPAGISELEIWLWRYAHDKRPVDQGGPDLEDLWEAFRHCVDILWNCKGSTRRVIWNAWTEKMLKAMVEHRYVGLAGCASSGKSDAAAVFSLVEWLAAPTETLCLITSTTIDGAKKRVWKSVTELWNSLEARWKHEGKSLPGKMLASGNNAQIKGIDINGQFSAALGICIVAADTSADQAASKKLKGLKAPAEGRGRLRLIADEMPDLGRSVYVAAVGNLNANPDFKCIALGNPRLKMDPFGEFCTPKAAGGYRSITVLDEQSETNLGVCIRFDAVKSPRMTEENGDTKYPWMPDKNYIEQIKGQFTEESAEWWSQVKGMWPPDGMSNSIWSEGELQAAKGAPEGFEWDNPTNVKRISGLDIPYTSGGDRAIYLWGECGMYKQKRTLLILGFKVLSEGITEETISGLTDEETGEAMTSNLILINQFKALNQELDISPRYSGIDTTSGGKIFGDWVTSAWKPGCRYINFGGKPIERITAFDEDEKQYGNRVAQLWCQPKTLVREGQVLGIPREVVMELCQRKFSDKQSSGKVYIEKKDDMKKRTGQSPDLADAFCILIEVAILNNLLDIEEVKKVEKAELTNWRNLVLGNYNPLSGDHTLGNPSPKRLPFKKTRSR